MQMLIHVDLTQAPTTTRFVHNIMLLPSRGKKLAKVNGKIQGTNKVNEVESPNQIEQIFSCPNSNMLTLYWCQHWGLMLAT